MMFHLYVLLAGSLCHTVTGQFLPPPSVTVLQDTTAVIPCPDPRPDVTWSCFIHGATVTLVSVKDGQKQKTDKRFELQADNSLVINNVKSDDTSLYLCNGKQVYLNVVTNSSVKETQPEGKVTPRNKEVDLESDQSGTAAAGDTVDQPSSDLCCSFYYVKVVAVVCAALLLLSISTLKFCSKTKTQKVHGGQNCDVAEETAP
ncbi:hypothetical protein Q8A73_002783 [Channa argus]|nr:hypothetical protein Q8A73_002783 [Channa argus]